MPSAEPGLTTEGTSHTTPGKPASAQNSLQSEATQFWELALIRKNDLRDGQGGGEQRESLFNTGQRCPPVWGSWEIVPGKPVKLSTLESSGVKFGIGMRQEKSMLVEYKMQLSVGAGTEVSAANYI